MKKIFLSAMMLMSVMGVKAQMTPEAVMGMVPTMPSLAEMIRYQKEAMDPNPEREMTQPRLYIDFLEALKNAREQADEQIKRNVGDVVEHKTLNAKVAGTNYTVRQVEGMSEAQQEQLGKDIMNQKLGSYGLSQADIAKMQSGNMSEAEQQALANKMMQNMTGGMNMQDVRFMQNMTDEERAQFMQMSGLNESTQAKMREQKPKLQKDAKVTALIKEMIKCDKQAKEVTDKYLQMSEEVRAAGRTLYDRDYRPQLAQWEAVKKEALAEGALSEKYTQADKPKVDAANRKFDNAQNQIWKIDCAFYEKYLPTWRDNLVKKMDLCRSQLLPIMQKKKEITDKLYSITKETQYASGAVYPFTAATAYLDTPEEIEQYGPFDENN